MFPLFWFRVFVTLLSVYNLFLLLLWLGYFTFDLNIFLHLIKKKKELSVYGIGWFGSSGPYLSIVSFYGWLLWANSALGITIDPY